MSRLSLVLSTVALVVAAMALATPFMRGGEQELDRAAIAAAVREVVVAEPGLSGTPAAQAGSQTNAGTDVVAAADSETIGPAVRQYLLENPEVLEEVIAALETRREDAQANAQRDAVASNREELATPEFSLAAGNPEGDVTLVEFFDYNCGFCKRMLPHITALMEADDNLRVVFREWPVLGEESQQAARVGLAVRQVAPEKYVEFHDTLLARNGRVGKGEAIEVASELGIDTTAIEAVMNSEETTAALQETFRLGDALGLRGTPSYVIGDKVFMGAVPREELESQIAQVRGETCVNC